MDMGTKISLLLPLLLLAAAATVLVHREIRVAPAHMLYTHKVFRGFYATVTAAVFGLIFLT